MDQKVISCAFHIDTACVEVKMVDGSMIATGKSAARLFPFWVCDIIFCSRCKKTVLFPFI